jgi:hypothetical protein
VCFGIAPCILIMSFLVFYPSRFETFKMEVPLMKPYVELPMPKHTTFLITLPSIFSSIFFSLVHTKRSFHSGMLQAVHIGVLGGTAGRCNTRSLTRSMSIDTCNIRATLIVVAYKMSSLATVNSDQPASSAGGTGKTGLEYSGDATLSQGSILS